MPRMLRDMLRAQFEADGLPVIDAGATRSTPQRQPLIPGVIVVGKPNADDRHIDHVARSAGDAIVLVVSADGSGVDVHAPGRKPQSLRQVGVGEIARMAARLLAGDREIHTSE